MKTKPIRVEKTWGHEDILCNSEKYCGKILFIKSGCASSWHYHKLKTEHFYIQSGNLLVKYGHDEDIEKSEQILLIPGDVFFVPVGLIHKLCAVTDVLMFEFSTQHFDSDSIRLKS